MAWTSFHAASACPLYSGVSRHSESCFSLWECLFVLPLFCYKQQHRQNLKNVSLLDCISVHRSRHVCAYIHKHIHTSHVPVHITHHVHIPGYLHPLWNVFSHIIQAKEIVPAPGTHRRQLLLLDDLSVLRPS